MQTQPTLSAREIIAAEYGRSANMVTPNRVAVGKISRTVAYELAWGHGILDQSSRLYGVSVVRVLDDGRTERDYDASGCFSSLDGANEHVRRLTAIEKTREDGFDA